MRTFKYGEPVLVSDDDKNWKPALITSYRHKEYYGYGVQVAGTSDTVWFKDCLTIKELNKHRTNEKMSRSKKELVDGFNEFLSNIPSRIRGQVSNKALINKYLEIQKEIVMKAYQEEYA